MGIAKNRPDIVYHYCSLDTFYKIISNATIRLSNVIKTNDREEMVYILPYLPVLGQKDAGVPEGEPERGQRPHGL